MLRIFISDLQWSAEIFHCTLWSMSPDHGGSKYIDKEKINDVISVNVDLLILFIYKMCISVCWFLGVELQFNISLYCQSEYAVNSYRFCWDNLRVPIYSGCLSINKHPQNVIHENFELHVIEISCNSEFVYSRIDNVCYLIILIKVRKHT